MSVETISAGKSISTVNNISSPTRRGGVEVGSTYKPMVAISKEGSMRTIPSQRESMSRKPVGNSYRPMFEITKEGVISKKGEPMMKIKQQPPTNVFSRSVFKPYQPDFSKISLDMREPSTKEMKLRTIYTAPKINAKPISPISERRTVTSLALKGESATRPESVPQVQQNQIMKDMQGHKDNYKIQPSSTQTKLLLDRTRAALQHIEQEKKVQRDVVVQPVRVDHQSTNQLPKADGKVSSHWNQVQKAYLELKTANDKVQHVHQTQREIQRERHPFVDMQRKKIERISTPQIKSVVKVLQQPKTEVNTHILSKQHEFATSMNVKKVKIPDILTHQTVRVGERIVVSQKMRVDKRLGMVMEVVELVPERDLATDHKRIKTATEVGLKLLKAARDKKQHGVPGYVIGRSMPRNPGQLLTSHIRKQLNLSLDTEAQYDAFKTALSTKGMLSSNEEIERAAVLAAQEAPAVRLVCSMSSIPVSAEDEARAVTDGQR